MKKHKQSLFTKKFDHLNSEDNCDDILWSSSESSDCENKSNTLFNNSCSNLRKRKRKIKKVNKNVSNLDIIEVPRKDNVSDRTPILSANNQSSPVLSSRCNQQHIKSPVLKSRYLKSFKNDINIPSSPILTSKVQKSEKTFSPVLKSKRLSPEITPKVKKKLFEGNQNKNYRKLINLSFDNHNQVGHEIKDSKNDMSKLNSENITDIEILETTPSESFNNKPKTKLDLMKCVKTYFDSHFSSESASQQSISECETATPQNLSKSSDDLEIATSMTQIQDLQLNQPHNSFLSSCETNINVEKTKRTRYKKGGLANRLADLIKKQNSNICLWQHEKFLATNSNFVIPKCEHTMFRIQNVQLKYGCYLIEAKDLKDDEYQLIINVVNVNCNSVLAPNYILKLYKPYKLLDNFKVIVNICKFECLPIKL